MYSPTPSNFNRPIIRGNNDSSNKPFQIILVILLVAVVVLILNQLVNGGQKQEQPVSDNVSVSPSPTEFVEPSSEPLETTITVTPSETIEVTPTGEVSANITTTVPGNWKVITEIPVLDYNFFRQNSWYFRLNGNTLGVDPSPLPSDGSYLGIITFTKSTKSLNTLINEYTTKLKADFSKGEVSAGPNNWTLIRGTQNKADDSGIINETKLGFITHGNANYILELTTSPASFPSYVANFDTELGILTFK